MTVCNGLLYACVPHAGEWAGAEATKSYFDSCCAAERGGSGGRRRRGEAEFEAFNASIPF